MSIRHLDRKPPNWSIFILDYDWFPFYFKLFAGVGGENYLQTASTHLNHIIELKNSLLNTVQIEDLFFSTHTSPSLKLMVSFAAQLYDIK